MGFPESVFKIIENNDCPMFEAGDRFVLTGKALFVEYKKDRTFIATAYMKMPEGKPMCRILAGDVTAILVEYENLAGLPGYVFDCSGCTGSVKLEYRNSRGRAAPAPPEPRAPRLAPAAPPEEAEPAKENKKVDAVIDLLSKFSFFRILGKEDIKQVIPHLKLKRYPEGAVVIKKGDPGKNLFVILAGKVDVSDGEGVKIASLGRGEVFGEMSLISGEPVGATVRVNEPAKIMYLTIKDFRKTMSQFPDLQMYFARLLARRLAKTNVDRIEESSSGMAGKLSDITPTELLQTLNVNQKTGVLSLLSTKGEASLVFREGMLVRAEYNSLKNEEAFFKVLSEKEGRFKFLPDLPRKYLTAEPIGDFMWLLMEGLNRIDEGGGQVR